MIEELKAYLEGIEADCLQLMQQGDLTEFGMGQLALIKSIKQKYFRQSLN